jgi:hypothetical protein
MNIIMNKLMCFIQKQSFEQKQKMIILLKFLNMIKS